MTVTVTGMGLAPVFLFLVTAQHEPGVTQPAVARPAVSVGTPRLDPALLGAFSAVRAKRYAEARAGAQRYLTLERHEHPGQAHFVIGLSYHQEQLYEPASASFTRALELEPGYVTTYFFHGFALLNLGRLDEAQASFEAFLGRAPEDAEVRFGLGLVALEQDRAQQAEQSLLRAIALVEARAGATVTAGQRSDLARYHARLGDVYLRLSDLTKARTALERSVELGPQRPEPWHKLARVLARQGDEAAARVAQARADAVRADRAPKEPTP